MTTVVAPAVRIGTRGSALALVQARLVADALSATGADPHIETIVTDGDRRAPDTAWGEGAFVGAIEAALLDGRVDVAVHSAKDVPTDEDPRLTIAAYLEREAADDVIVLPAGHRDPAADPDRAPEAGHDALDLLPAGARVGTDSPRRTAFLLAARPDLRLHPLHGNVDTRLRRLDEGQTDALVLAAAGLRRLGRGDRISAVLPSALVPPAPGQGALAIQVRTADAATRAIVARLDHAPTRRAVEAERALLAASGGGCRAPLGAIGTVRGDRLTLLAGSARPDGRVIGSATRTGGPGADADLVAGTLADLAADAAARALALGAPRVVVTRAWPDGAATLLALVDRGLAPLHVPTIDIARSPADEAALDAAVRDWAALDWVVVTSAHAVAALGAAIDRAGIDRAGPGPRWAAVGGATRRAVLAIGVTPAFVPDRATGADLAEALPDVADARILLPRSDLGDAALPRRLADRGARVESVVAYRTTTAPLTSRDELGRALGHGPSAVIAASPSAVRGWLELARAIGAEPAVRAIGLVAIGPSTAAAARDHDLTVIAEATSPAPAAIADAAAEALRTLEETR
jgi:hydroxymethylbilane synthase